MRRVECVLICRGYCGGRRCEKDCGVWEPAADPVTIFAVIEWEGERPRGVFRRLVGYFLDGAAADEHERTGDQGPVAFPPVIA